MIVWRNKFYLDVFWELFHLNNNKFLYDETFNKRNFVIKNFANKKVIKNFNCGKKDYG